MLSFKQRVVAYLEQEWGTYVQRFNSLSKTEGVKRVNAMGYGSFRDLLAHIVAWWEEGMPIVLAIAEDREYERRKYDFAVFNAEAVAKYKSWGEAEFLSHFEKVRLKTAAELRSMKEAAYEDRRVRNWLHGIIILHAREHLLVVSRFLTEDTLEYEWAAYISAYNLVSPERQAEWLKGQGFVRFQDILAHIIGWWEEGLYVIDKIKNDPEFKWEERDTDGFNAELVEKYSSWIEADVFAEFEKVRMNSLEFVKCLSDEDFRNPVIADQLSADFIVHIDEH